ncbi:MAG TPA: class I SAM-dependent methyltransferase [Kofleriaceae bacterium]|jgi:ubiquinone/menaquinone biosynthesis C-methylase UbiE
MLLNRVEKLMMNNPLRAAVQRRFEARRLLDMGGPATGAHCLEIGCGRGVGTQIVLDRFGAAEVDAFDLDPDMVEQARARLGDDPRVRLWVGDATAIDAPDGAYDAVFDFGIVHHVPSWRDAIREVHRVLRPGGRFYAEEVLARFIHHPVWRRLLDHPMEDRFDAAGFARGLEEQGFQLVARRELLGQVAWFVADKPNG